MISEPSDQPIGWKATSKTGVVAAGGAEAVSAGIEVAPSRNQLVVVQRYGLDGSGATGGFL